MNQSDQFRVNAIAVFRNLNGRNSLAGAAARSPLKTVHWTVFRAFRTHGACSLSIDLRSDEISATGGHRIFAQSTDGTLTAVAWQLYSAISMVVTPHSGAYSLSIDLRFDEISATGGHRIFAPNHRFGQLLN